MSRSKPKVRVPAKERQLLLDFLRVLYVDAVEIERKPPSPEHPKPALLQMRKAGAA